jgi:hypothetical protein
VDGRTPAAHGAVDGHAGHPARQDGLP